MLTEGLGDVGVRSASTPSADADVRCHKGRSGAPGERRRRGSTTANVESGAVEFDASEKVSSGSRDSGFRGNTTGFE